MKIIFDKGLETEKSVAVDRVAVRPLQNRITGNRSGTVAAGVPDLSAFTVETFQTIAVETDAGEQIPLTGSYSKIGDVAVTYEDAGASYHVSIAVE